MFLYRMPFSMAFASLLLAGAPAFADTAVVLDNNQTTVITGNSNNASNISNQSVRTSTSGRGGDTGVSVRNQQTCDIVGNENTCINRSDQQVDIRRHRR